MHLLAVRRKLKVPDRSAVTSWGGRVHMASLSLHLEAATNPLHDQIAALTQTQAALEARIRELEKEVEGMKGENAQRSD